LQIFISFASEQREAAELIAVAVRERGYKVFFSRDTLPAAESFDVRIGQAVKSSDLFVFLLSPESVTKGKYTLTELSFAREQWDSPDGHVLPVMVAPTEIGKIPVYLRSVSILEPEGNLAADTAAQVDKILKKRGRNDVLHFALAGAVSGALSYVVMLYWPNALRIPFVFPSDELESSGVTAVPGLVFGALVALCNWRFGIRDRLHLGVITAFTLVAWVLAVNVAQFSFNQISAYTRALPSPAIAGGAATPNQDDASGGNTGGDAAGKSDIDPGSVPIPPPTQTLPFMPALVGMVGGLIGGAVTLLGIAIVNVSVRRLETLLPIVTVAVLLGATLQVAFLHGWYGSAGYALLFVSWQSAVVAMLTRALLTTAAESQ
jgi:hypothetical protein